VLLFKLLNHPFFFPALPYFQTRLNHYIQTTVVLFVMFSDLPGRNADPLFQYAFFEQK
jgi:hypothetical protein